MNKTNLAILYMNKDLETVHHIYKDVEFLAKEMPNPTINYIKEALEELEQQIKVQISNLNK